MCPTSLKRVKQNKVQQNTKLHGYKEGFDPTYMESDENSDESEVDDTEKDNFEVVGKTKEVKVPV
jgi:hypothetical protein